MPFDWLNDIKHKAFVSIEFIFPEVHLNFSRPFRRVHPRFALGAHSNRQEVDILIGNLERNRSMLEGGVQRSADPYICICFPIIGKVSLSFIETEGIISSRNERSVRQLFPAEQEVETPTAQNKKAPLKGRRGKKKARPHHPGTLVIAGKGRRRGGDLP